MSQTPNGVLSIDDRVKEPEENGSNMLAPVTVAQLPALNGSAISTLRHRGCSRPALVGGGEGAGVVESAFALAARSATVQLA